MSAIALAGEGKGYRKTWESDAARIAVTFDADGLVVGMSATPGEASILAWFKEWLGHLIGEHERAVHPKDDGQTPEANECQNRSAYSHSARILSCSRGRTS